MNLHPILDDTDACIELVARYYSGEAKYGLPRSGSHFDHWDGGGDRSEIRNELTADDFLAVSFLYVNVPPEAAIGLLGDCKPDVEALLEQIPYDRHLADLSSDEYQKYLGPEGPAQELWDLLTSKPSPKRNASYKWGIGPTTASKIMARKRPNLIPITDERVGDLVGRKGDYWRQWYMALTDSSRLPERLQQIKENAEIGQDPSLLRVLDVILWMHATDLEWATRNSPRDGGGNGSGTAISGSIEKSGSTNALAVLDGAVK